MPAEDIRPEIDLRFSADRDAPMKGTLRLSVGDGVFMDRVNLADRKSRDKFAADARAEFPALPADELDRELRKTADQQFMRQSDPEPDGTDQSQQWQPSAEARSDAEKLLVRDDLLAEVVDTAADIGIVGERSLVTLAYLVATSRLLPQPLYLLLSGDPSSGKSFVARTIAKRLLPMQHVVEITDLSPMSLYYLQRDISHRLIVLGERKRQLDEGAIDATRAIRELVEAGELIKTIPVRDKNGRMATEEFKVSGPVALIETSSHNYIADEDRTRMIRAWTDESERQTRAVNRDKAERYAGLRPSPSQRRIDAVRAVQLLLEPHPVIVPFAVHVAEVFPADKVESRRAFERLLAVTCASAILHQRQRERKGEHVVADEDDFRLAEIVLRPWLASALTDDVTPAARDTWEAIRQRADDFTAGDILADGNAKPSAARRRKVQRHLRELADAGALETVDNRRGVPKRYRVSNPDWQPGIVDLAGACRTVAPDVEAA